MSRPPCNGEEYCEKCDEFYEPYITSCKCPCAKQDPKRTHEVFLKLKEEMEYSKCIKNNVHK